MNKLQQVIRSYFSFSIRETNGFLFMSIATIVCLGCYLAVSNPSNYSVEQQERDETILENLVVKIEQQTVKIAEEKKRAYQNRYPKKKYSKSHKSNWNKKSDTYKKKRKALSPTRFNPNNVSKTELLGMGIPKYWVERIVKARAKGWKFRTKSDLAKLYNFPKELFSELESHIDLPNEIVYSKTTDSENNRPTSESSHKYKPYQKKIYAPNPFDLNLADTADLVQIRGIGTKTALRIINYRNELGGFISLDQLSEVWSLKNEVITELSKYTSVSNLEIRKLKVNDLNLDDLRAHPYIYYKQANAIVNYRNHHGKFRSISDMKKIILLDDTFLRKIEPYLSFE